MSSELRDELFITKRCFERGMRESKSKMTVQIFFSDCAGQLDPSSQSSHSNEYVDTLLDLLHGFTGSDKNGLEPYYLIAS